MNPDNIASIPSNLHAKLRAVLLECGPFVTDQELTAVFIDKRLKPWRNRLPQADNPIGRVERVIDLLHNQYNDLGENALVLLLRVLRDRLESGDACHHRLAQLADELEREIKSLDPTTTPPKVKQRQYERLETQIKYVIIINLILAVPLSLLISNSNTSSFFCTPTAISSSSLAIIILLVVHLLWRVLSSAADVETGETFKAFGIEFPIRFFQSIIDACHPWRLTDAIFWSSTIATIIIIWTFGLNPFPPFSTRGSSPRPDLHYSISREGNPEEVIKNPDLQLLPGEIVTIEAITNNPICKWESSNGVLTKIDGCIVTYVAPQLPENAASLLDFIHITVSTKCNTAILYHSINVLISNEER